MKTLEDSTTRKILIVLPVAAILIGGLVVTMDSAAFASSSPALGIVIPLYTYPTSSTWSQVIQAKQAYPNVPIIAIINPDSGPGPSQDSNYVQGIQALQAAGVTVYGYVDTAYAGDSISSVEANVNLYVSWYHVNGILFDDMNNQVGYESYYATLGSYVSSLGLKSMGNPGTSVPTSFIGTLDALCIYEGSGLPSLSFITYPGYSPSNFAVIALGVPLDTTFLSSVSSLVGWVYLTDASGSNPYDVLPSYFTSEVAAVSSIDGSGAVSSTSSLPPSSSSTTSTTTTSASSGAVSLAVDTVDLSGNPLSGLWATWSQGGSLLATGYTPATFAGTDGQTYSLTVANYSNYVFCSWEDGGTNSTREVTLSGDATLTAVYSTSGSCPATTYPVLVQSDYYNGTSLAGMYLTVTSGGAAVASGYTPLSFTAVTGAQYVVSVDNYGSLVFNHWSTGNTSASLTVTPSASTVLTAYYSSPVALTVDSASTSGGTVTGASASVASGTTTIASGPIPLVATVMTGGQYNVTVTPPQGWTFAHWADGTTSPSKTVTPSQSTTMTAYFTKLPTTVKVTVESVKLSGKQFSGMWLSVTSGGNTVATGYTTLTFTANVGQTYTISMSNWKNYVFAHWGSGSTDPVLTITPTQATTLVAYYNT